MLIFEGSKIAFADFLDIMHHHTTMENIPNEIIEAFRVYDEAGSGVITAKDLRHVLSGWGEKVSPREGTGFSIVYNNN